MRTKIITSYRRTADRITYKYGYKNKQFIGLKEWYQDYMNKEIKTKSGEKIGLPSEIFIKKPAKITDFEFSHKLDYFNEPENIIEELSNITHKLINLFSNAKQIEAEE